MIKRLIWLLPTLFVLMLLDGIFIVDQRRQAIVLQFGHFITSHTDPGLKFKIPFIQSVQFYEKRVLGYDLPPIAVTLGDQKRLEVDTYTRYSIQDPLLFYRSIEPATEQGARLRLETIISSAVRNQLGKVALSQLLSEKRSRIMHQIETEVSQRAKQWGLEIVDVRIIRTELPSENREAIFSRMNAELDRFAKENRAKGYEQAQSIRAKADRERTVLLATANKERKLLEAQASSDWLRITTMAYEKNRTFYNLYRNLILNEDGFTQNSELILSTDGMFAPILNTLTTSHALTKSLEKSE